MTASFTVIPAIDLKEGRCVRLWRGEMERETVYSENPGEMAQAWEEAGASIIHLVDLDGAVRGEVVNRQAVEGIVAATSVPLELGGGIRDRATMDDYFSLGIGRVILGTAACREPERLGEMIKGFPGEVYVGIDAREGLVAVEGWRETLSLEAAEMAIMAQRAGADGVIYTDIMRDGTMTGPNFESLARLADRVELPVIASGGVSTLEDIARLAGMSPSGVTGVIVGRALYDGRVDLKEAISLCTAGPGGVKPG
jgi:phosphoribosylformimino-5-aminoimidazole carboxamide ribotide isomerase